MDLQSHIVSVVGRQHTQDNAVRVTARNKVRGGSVHAHAHAFTHTQTHTQKNLCLKRDGSRIIVFFCDSRVEKFG